MKLHLVIPSTMEEIPQPSHLSVAQKIGFVLLLVFGLMVVSLAFLQIRNAIYGPFVIRVNKDEQALKNALHVDDTIRLQQIDTDHDGLNDYEELFFYETSPYIPDTDSDGIDDKAEVDAGTNPLCPEGTACDASVFDVVTSSTLEVTPLQDSIALPDEIVADAQDDVVKELGKDIDMVEIASDPDLLRQLLLQTGQISAEQLDAIDDETLLKFAKDIVSVSATSTQ